jgi:hypothetical protein
MLAGNSTRTQLVYAQPFASGTTLLGIRLRCAASTVDRAAFTATMEVRCSSSANAPGALSTTFASNVGSDVVVVLPQQTVNIPAMPANRGTGTTAEILFTTPFVFGTNGNTNLVVDVLVSGRSAGASWSTDRAFASNNGSAITNGRGCGTATIASTSTGGTYVGGATVNVTLAAAPANTIALLVPTLDQREFAPGVQLPFDLSLVGMAPGCALLVNPEAGLLPFVVDAAGGATASLPIPATFTSQGLGFHWLYLVPSTTANPLGIEATAARSVFIGPIPGAPLFQYAYDLFDVNDPTATLTNAMPIAELIIQ